MNATSRNDRTTGDMNGFAVRVYRKTEQHGWQAMQPKNAQGRLVQVRATPKEGCVVLHRIQVRIRLTSSQSNNSLKESDENTRYQSFGNTNTNSKSSGANDVLVVRRRHYILISSRLRSRSLVFKFKDLKSCLQFSDQLVQLNPHQTIQTTTPSFDRKGSTSGEIRTMTEQNNKSKLHYEKDMQQVLSYVGRLLYDDNFATFCNNLESNVMASEDGVHMFNSLVGQTKNDSSQKS